MSFVRAVLLLSCISECSASGLIGFADAGSHERNVHEPKRYSFGPNDGAKPAAYAIAKLDSMGSVTGMSQNILFTDDAMMPGCNAGLDERKKVFYKTTIKVSTYLPTTCKPSCPSGSTCCRDPTTPSDTGACFNVHDCSQMPAGTGAGGRILTIDATSGKILHNVSMTGDVAHPVFGAFDASSGLLYSMIPYSYTEFGLFSFNPATGAVQKLAQWAKSQMDGIGLCDGLVFNSGRQLIYQMGSKTDYLTVVDLKTFKVVNTVQGFYGPIVVDPLHQDHLLAIRNVHRNGVSLVWMDPMKNVTRTVFHLNATSLGKDLRAQDQASMAVDPSGASVWFIASYNDPKTGLLYRGVYTVQLAEDRSQGTLVSEKAAFGDKSGVWIGKLDYAADVGGAKDVVV